MSAKTNTVEEQCPECNQIFLNHKDFHFHSNPCQCGNMFDCNPKVKLCDIIESNGAICQMGLCDLVCEEWHKFRHHFLKIKCQICSEEHFTHNHVK